MPPIAFRAPCAEPLHNYGWPRPPAVFEFVVTQRFNDPDSYWSNLPNPPMPLPTHNAVDIGNFRCGDPILAMAPGVATRIQDNATSFGAPTNALGERIDHGQGIQTEYWHLDSQTAQTGQAVVAGQEIGKLGATGLGSVCHCHITMRRNGNLIDPLPFMFGAALDPATGAALQLPRLEEDDEMTWLPNLQPLRPYLATMRDGARLYKGPGRDYPEHYAPPAGTRYHVLGLVDRTNDPVAQSPEVNSAGLWYLAVQPDYARPPGFFFAGSAEDPAQRIPITAPAAAPVPDGRIDSARRVIDRLAQAHGAMGVAIVEAQATLAE